MSATGMDYTPVAFGEEYTVPSSRDCVVQNAVEHLGVEDQRLDIVPDLLHMHVAVDQVDSLGAQPVPEQLAIAAGRFHRLIHLGQPLIILLVGRQAGVRRKRLPEGAQYVVLGREPVAGRVIRQALLRRHQALVTADAAIHAGKKVDTGQHLQRQRLPHLVDVGDHLLDRLLVEIQRLGHVIENADVIDDQAMGLGLAKSAVGATDRL